MDGFSVASLTSTCSSLCHRALSTAVEIDELQKAANPSGDGAGCLERLKFLGTELLQLRQHTDTLQECLATASTISPKLQQVAMRSLRECDAASAVLEKQVQRLHPQSLGRLNLATISTFDDLLVTYSRLFIFATQLLSTPSAAFQDSKLDHSDGHGLVVAAEAASRRILRGVDILAGPTKHRATNGTTSEPGLTDGTAPSVATETASSTSTLLDRPSDDASSPEQARGPLAKGLASLTNSLKAMAAGMRPRPEPFVSALCQAATYGHIKEIGGLLDQGANINGRNEDGSTALICAITSGQRDTAIFLLENGADKSVRPTSGKRRPPLYHAIGVGDLETAQYLLDHGASVNEKDMYGQSYFVEVVQSENLDMIQLLLGFGADVQAREHTGRPIIAYAVNRGNMQLVRLLLGHGADANARDYTGAPILSIASSKDQLELIQLLLGCGADPNTRTLTGTPLLVDAVQRGRVEAAEMLLSVGANANVNDLMGSSILLSTVRNDKLGDADKDKLVRALLARGANPNATDSWGVTGLAHAAAGDNLDMVRLFLAHGADADKPIHGDTLLVNAIDGRRWEQARLLLRHGGANPNKADKQGRTPMLVAMQKQDADMVNLLLSLGADVNQAGCVTPAGVARVWGDRSVLQALRRRGAAGLADDTTPSTSRRSNRGNPASTGSPPPPQPSQEEKPPRPDSPPPGYHE